MGKLTLGEFVQFMAYVTMLSWPMISLGWVGTMWQQGTASLWRIHEVLSIAPRIVVTQTRSSGNRPGKLSSATSRW